MHRMDRELDEELALREIAGLTHDLDFSAILAATNGNKPSVVQIRAENVSVDVLRDKVVMAINQMAPELENGALLTIDSRHARLRVLPLQSG